MQVAYYPGCTIKASARQHETAALAALGALGVELREMEEWHCCGVVHSLTSDNLMRHVAPIRLLARLQQQGAGEFATLCDMCYNTLARADQLAQQQPQRLASVNDFIAPEPGYHGRVGVLHMLQILRDRIGFKAIRKRVRRPLAGLTVLPYYGCKLLRPGVVGIDDPETPAVLRDLMEALGATVVDDPVQTQCCGAYHVVNRDEIVRGRVEATVAQARARGAAAMVLSCPLCHFNFDSRQTEVAAPLPVFYFTQLMAVAFGLERSVFGFEAHQIDPWPLLRQHGLA